MSKAMEPATEPEVGGDFRYFCKVQAMTSGSKEVKFAVAFGQTITRARADGAFHLICKLVERIVESREIDLAQSTPYYALAASLCKHVLKGQWSAAEDLIKKAKDRNLDQDAVDQIAAIYNLQ